MADKLDDLVSGVLNHIADKKGELLALNTRISADRSIQHDLAMEIAEQQETIAKNKEKIDGLHEHCVGMIEFAYKKANDVLVSINKILAKGSA